MIHFRLEVKNFVEVLDYGLGLNAPDRHMLAGIVCPWVAVHEQGYSAIKTDLIAYFQSGAAAYLHFHFVALFLGSIDSGLSSLALMRHTAHISPGSSRSPDSYRCHVLSFSSINSAACVCVNPHFVRHSMMSLGRGLSIVFSLLLFVSRDGIDPPCAVGALALQERDCCRIVFARLIVAHGRSGKQNASDSPGCRPVALRALFVHAHQFVLSCS